MTCQYSPPFATFSPQKAAVDRWRSTRLMELVSRYLCTSMCVGDAEFQGKIRFLTAEGQTVTFIHRIIETEYGHLYLGTLNKEWVSKRTAAICCYTTIILLGNWRKVWTGPSFVRTKKCNRGCGIGSPNSHNSSLTESSLPWYPQEEKCAVNSGEYRHVNTQLTFPPSFIWLPHISCCNIEKWCFRMMEY